METTEPDTGSDAPASEPDKDLAAEVDKWKQLARKHEQQAKANADAAKKLKELEDADKSEIERATAKVAEADKRAADAEIKALRMEVAADKGLTLKQARRLQGSTRDELESDADELIEDLGIGTQSEPDTGTEPEPDTGDDQGLSRPKERLKPGSSNQEEPEEDAEKVADRIFSRNRL